MGRNLIETVMGAVVLLVAAGFLAFAYSHSNLRSVQGYNLTARFERIDGVNPGTDVRISGIKVGTVVSERLDPERFQAIVTLTIDSSIKLPADTIAEVATEGLLGGRFMALVPGGADEILKPGDEIKYTQSPIDVVQLLGRFIFSMGEASQQKPGAGPQKPAP
ncbi:MAG: outer membrane lipid asymmetry maintenance protein MlaD [Proteobacteria bacterium]|nr:outer membrane lipid asymmetry maintenance protein MlaD [Pseudomonadota bacterium]MBI3497968.1 outer membrane lipid asymmetry maintenance protein MlaD [Pseudomonadota bacterium]